MNTVLVGFVIGGILCIVIGRILRARLRRAEDRLAEERLRHAETLLPKDPR